MGSDGLFDKLTNSDIV